jgi:hypothetical protein
MMASVVVAGMATLGLSSAVHAHVNSVQITAQCAGDGLTRTVTATVGNSWAQAEDAIVGSENGAHFTPPHLNILRRGTGVMTATIPGDQTGTVELTILGRWTDHHSATTSGSLSVGTRCR